ncbi:sulfite exporter TauE/SafE family protein [Sedimentitalea sp. HM32M-2]|uniref:sulfite exporter TauE/SafE family protein n=1 Tax=Sedimentitalea sp. HM32M-2 TaxID=3351566 RepID=UPI00362AB9D0
MLELDAGFFALAGPAVLLAGISKAGFGSGAAFASATILALSLQPAMALGIMLPLLMLIDLASLPPYWRQWSWPEAKVLILGGIPGVALGAWLFRQADDDVLRLLIGSIALAFVAWQVAQQKGWLRPNASKMPTAIGLLAGLVTGFTSFVSHAGGPPAAIYLLSQRLSKTGFQGTTVLVFWAINIAKAIPYSFLGMFTVQTAKADLLLVPFALLGTWLGVRAHRFVPELLFFRITHVLLVLTGSKLIWDALT